MPMPMPEAEYTIDIARVDFLGQTILTRKDLVSRPPQPILVSLYFLER